MAVVLTAQVFMWRKSGHCQRFIFSASTCMQHNHGVSTLQTAQKQFFIVLGVVIIMFFLLELRMWPVSERIRPPQAVKSRLFVTCECGYDRRLGNSMFSFAAAIGIGRLNNMTAVVERSSPLVETFRILEPISIDMDNTMAYKSVNYFEYGHRGSAYDRGTHNLFIGSQPSSVHLRGYFQSWRYFDNVVDRVRQNYVFHEHIVTESKLFLSSVEPAVWKENGVDFVRVGVHVRRGDMMSPRTSSFGYTVAPPNYFRSAMKYFAERYYHVQFVVCSDDIEWCQSSLPVAADIGSNVNIVFSENRSPKVDLAILVHCNHTIMSVGSFGWWAAWLTNGTTIYYGDWPRPFSQLEYHVNKDDYFPKHWIPM